MLLCYSSSWFLVLNKNNENALCGKDYSFDKFSLRWPSALEQEPITLSSWSTTVNESLSY